ncbi:hypothetical protein WMF20_15990 [Sorangium sp. So ce834]|uniref:hypothetical protein n=1 Tax=Sorangium sp. So ce834 TaxID=3133321 RepID=UPI003F641544
MSNVACRASGERFEAFLRPRRPPFVDLRDLCMRHLRRRPGGIASGARALQAGEPAPRGAGRCGRTVGWLEVVLARLLALAGEDTAPGS